MKFCLLLIFCFTLPIFSKAQTNIVDASLKIKQLKESGISTIICFYYGSSWPPVVAGKDTCFPHDVKYLLWKEDTKCQIQRFDNCKYNAPEPIDNDIIDIVIHHLKQLDAERIKPPAYINSKKKTIEMIESDGGYIVLEIYNGDKLITKNVDLYCLNTKFVDKHLNINYAHNQQSQFNKLKNIIEAEIKRLNK